MEVHFTPEQEARLTQIARRVGTGAEKLVRDAALRLLSLKRYTAAELADQHGNGRFPMKTTLGWTHLQ